MITITIIIFLIVLIILYKIFSYQITTYYLNKKINKLKPTVIRLLNNQKKGWEEKVNKFNEDDRVTRMTYKDTTVIMENIEGINKDLYVVKNYEILKLKLMGKMDGKKDKIEMGISLCFVKYLECLLDLGKLLIEVTSISILPPQNIIDLIFHYRKKQESLYQFFKEVIEN